jgi:hypothetical protein
MNMSPIVPQANVESLGASGVLEGYSLGLNKWPDRNRRLRENSVAIDRLREYFRNPTLALGVDAKRLGIDDDKLTLDGKPFPGVVAAKQALAAAPGDPALAAKLTAQQDKARNTLRRFYLIRLSRVTSGTDRHVPGVGLDTWVSRFEGDANADAQDVAALLGHKAFA